MFLGISVPCHAFLYDEVYSPPSEITHTYSYPTADGRLVYNMERHKIFSAFKETSGGSVEISNRWSSINALSRAHLGPDEPLRLFNKPEYKMLRELHYVGACEIKYAEPSQ